MSQTLLTLVTEAGEWWDKPGYGDWPEVYDIEKFEVER